MRSGSHHNNIIGMKDVSFFIFFIVMDLENIFFLKKIFYFLDFSILVALCCDWKGKKIFLGLIGEYFDNLDGSTQNLDQINLESWLSQSSLTSSWWNQ